MAKNFHCFSDTFAYEIGTVQSNRQSEKAPSNSNEKKTSKGIGFSDAHILGPVFDVTVLDLLAKFRKKNEWNRIGYFSASILDLNAFPT